MDLSRILNPLPVLSSPHPYARQSICGGDFPILTQQENLTILPCRILHPR